MTEQINFFKGHPTINLLPHKQLSDSFQKVLLTSGNSNFDYENNPDNRHPLQYGTDPGNLSIRESIFRWSSSRYNRPMADPDTFNLTNGSSFGALTILTGCTNHEITKHAFLVSPTYFLINTTFFDFGFEGKMSAINETPGGEYEIDLPHLEARLHQLNEKYGYSQVASEEINILSTFDRGPRKVYRYVMYMVPSFSNPGGLTYSQKTRTKLLEIARLNDLLVITDDVYDFLHYNDGPAVPKVTHIDLDTLPKGWKYGNSISNASFSKIIAPGLRVGWHETPTELLAQQLATIGAVRSAGTPSQLNTFVVQDLIETGQLNGIIEKLVSVYTLRAKVMIDAIKESLPLKYTEVYGGDGGYFVWVGIKADGVDLKKTIQEVETKHHVVIADGSNFEVAGDAQGWGKTNARLCVALLTEEQIQKGIKLWAEVIRAHYPHLYD